MKRDIFKLLFYASFLFGLSACDKVLGIKDQLSLDFTGQILTSLSTVPEGEQIELVFQLDYPAQRVLTLQLVYDSAPDSALAPQSITIPKGEIEARVSFVVPLDNIYQRRTRELDIKAYYRQFLFDRTTFEITNSDPFPQVTMRNQTGSGIANINEGTTVNLTATLQRRSDSDLDFDYEVVHVSTVNGDVNITPGTITVPAGALTASFSISTAQNNVCVNNKSFRVNLTPPNDSPWGVTQFNQTLQEYGGPQYTISGDTTLNEGQAGTVTLTAARPCTFNRSIRFTVQNTSGYTAVAGVNFQSKVETLTLPANQTTVVANFQTLSDGVYSANKTLRVLFSNYSPVVNNSPSRSLTVNIVNQDSAPTVEWSLTSSHQVRGGAPASYNLDWVRTGSSELPVEVGITYGGSAVRDLDFSGPSSITVGADTSGSVPITILPKSTYTGTETIELTLTPVSGAQIGAQATHTLTVSDVLPTLSLSTSNVTEGDLALVTVNLNRASSESIQVDYQTQDDSALEGVDYQQTTGTLFFAPGETSQTFQVSTFPNDIEDPAARRFLVQLYSPVNASLAVASASVEILDDDVMPLMGLAVKKVSANQADLSPLLEIKPRSFALLGWLEGEAHLLWVSPKGTQSVVTRSQDARVVDYAISDRGLVFISNNHLKGHFNLYLKKDFDQPAKLLTPGFEAPESVKKMSLNGDGVLYQTANHQVWIASLVTRHSRLIDLKLDHSVHQIFTFAQGWIVFSGEGVYKITSAGKVFSLEPEEAEALLEHQSRSLSSEKIDLRSAGARLLTREHYLEYLFEQEERRLILEVDYNFSARVRNLEE